VLLDKQQKYFPLTVERVPKDGGRPNRLESVVPDRHPNPVRYAHQRYIHDYISIGLANHKRIWRSGTTYKLPRQQNGRYSALCQDPTTIYIYS
jgi:hypothetical protein